MLLTCLTILVMLGLFVGFAFLRVRLPGWVFFWILCVFVFASQSRITDDTLMMVCLAMLAASLLFVIPAVRYAILSRHILKAFRKTMPQISATEQEAINAGTVWWEGELFSGRPDWNKLHAFPRCELSDEEKKFLNNEVEQLCAMLDDWEITHKQADLPPDVWQFIKDKGFFGMIIPRKYGGLGFSAQAHSAVVSKVASRSGTAAVTVMVPNSLGPAELLLHYGTDTQKEKYLRRLAKGLDVPCFALTGPFAGSDAAAIPDYGVVCKGKFGGVEVTGIKVTWEKRYITLAPAATLLGLAFKLYDPERLLGGDINRGITLALIPTDTPGVKIGRRHFPLNAAFLNGPTQGKEVFIPMDYLIGGEAFIGQGWRMLMECLAAGRSISLPASSVGGMKLAARTCGAYSRVRKQFKMPIGKFEGVEEPLARIGAYTYMIDAARRLTALAIDLEQKPSVISAIIKYHATERGRKVINDAMDIHGGKAIILGPDNYLARFYQQLPIGITVEGANILTRSLMIFGQGAIRSHPYVLKEISAVNEPNPQRALYLFDEALFQHINFTLSNAARSWVLGLTKGRGFFTHGNRETKRYYQQLSQFSAAFALCADMAMLVLGGALKRNEKLSARLGDMLSLMYLGSATLKRFEDDNKPVDDLPLLHWAMQDCLYGIQQALHEFILNFPNKLLALMLRNIIFPLGLRVSPPTDKLGHRVAGLMMAPGATRDRLTDGMYIPPNDHEAVGALEAALTSTLNCEALQDKVEEARKAGRLLGFGELQRIKEARDKNILNKEQTEMLEKDYALRRKVIMVNDFAAEELQAGKG